jgi:polysaccharide pyruvyl transferase WcaK-like protein
VIEHVQDPQAFVAKIHQLLEPEGEVLIECPSWEIHSYGSVSHTLWAPHIHYFSAPSMYQLLSSSFEVIDIGFLGVAIYIHARKSDRSTFNAKDLSRFKRLSKRVYRWNSLIPRIKITSGSFPLTTTQLLLQPFLQKTTQASWNKLKTAGGFAPREWWYRQKEAGLFKGKRAVHLSYYSGWENAGDTVLSKCVRDSFRLLPADSWLLRKVTAAVTPRLIDEINRGPFLLIGGGGLLLPDSNPNSKSGWQWAVSAQELEQIKVPIIVYAIGYNYFPGQKPNDLFIQSLIRIVEKSIFFGLRNQGSINAVKQLIPEHLHHKIRHQPCPTTLVRYFEPQLPAKTVTKNVAINVAYDRYKNRFGADVYTILDQMALAMKSLQDQGYNIFNACHLKDDSKFELSLDRRGVRYQSVQLQFAVPSEVYAFYNNMELVMGLRGHAQMIPFGVNCKIISLGSHNKLRYFLEDIEAADWFVDLKTDPESISERILATFDAIQNHSEQTRNRLKQAQEQLYQTTVQNMQEIKELLQ